MVMVAASSLHAHKVLSSCNQISPSFLHFSQRYNNPISQQPQQRRRHSSSFNGAYSYVIKAYMENPNSISGFANKVIGSLPIIGLVARIFSDEGGVGGDIIDFAEFRRRVGKKCTVTDSRAFYEFQQRRGRAGDPLYVLLCCWLAAVGAGLLKSEEILEGVARLRISNDIEFEEQNFIAMMNEARERRAKLNAGAPNLPMVIRAEKAVDAIYVCCFGRDPIEEEEESLLDIMLRAVFPTVEQSTIQKIIKEKAIKVAEGGDDADIVPEPKPLSKEAVQMQMKDLEFLKQNKET
ncbi:deoxynucleoside triphosphate triphosphohydrolase SAMHD1-like protein [Hibiscus syriacus]|uniref:Deoxynucleoside triphosphate triphosphohydrolase SAMHD1-like protein n=1 Tax=Hibiscus syriacus TaxID=106335 RepID=A0A6A2ZRQ4_HIBSY|nr:photosystem I assembly factor PSA3, chloroplastic-like [Hibiscus syriacus]KAE8694147.1 deoxynucleoside triphosphate triphosphohydrolase SAMHD1-like protein [Hibiscus syriacus]